MSPQKKQRSVSHRDPLGTVASSNIASFKVKHSDFTIASTVLPWAWVVPPDKHVWSSYMLSHDMSYSLALNIKYILFCAGPCMQTWLL